MPSISRALSMRAALSTLSAPIEPGAFADSDRECRIGAAAPDHHHGRVVERIAERHRELRPAFVLQHASATEHRCMQRAHAQRRRHARDGGARSAHRQRPAEHRGSARSRGPARCTGMKGSRAALPAKREGKLRVRRRASQDDSAAGCDFRDGGAGFLPWCLDDRKRARARELIDEVAGLIANDDQRTLQRHGRTQRY